MGQIRVSRLRASFVILHRIKKEKRRKTWPILTGQGRLQLRHTPIPQNFVARSMEWAWGDAEMGVRQQWVSDATQEWACCVTWNGRVATVTWPAYWFNHPGGQSGSQRRSLRPNFTFCSLEVWPLLESEIQNDIKLRASSIQAGVLLLIENSRELLHIVLGSVSHTRGILWWNRRRTAHSRCSRLCLHAVRRVFWIVGERGSQASTRQANRVFPFLLHRGFFTACWNLSSAVGRHPPDSTKTALLEQTFYGSLPASILPSMLEGYMGSPHGLLMRQQLLRSAWSPDEAARMLF